MAQNYDLMKDLEAAAAGLRATSGPDAPNLFASARAELKRLYAIEEDVTALLRPIHHLQDLPNYHDSRRLGQAAEDRVKAATRLGKAVGVFKEKESARG